MNTIRKVHPSFQIAIEAESSNSRLDACNGVSHPVRISTVEKKETDGTIRVAGNFEKFVLNEKIQHAFNKRALKRGKNGPNTFEVLL